MVRKAKFRKVKVAIFLLLSLSFLAQAQDQAANKKENTSVSEKLIDREKDISCLRKNLDGRPLEVKRGLEHYQQAKEKKSKKIWEKACSGASYMACIPLAFTSFKYRNWDDALDLFFIACGNGFPDFCLDKVSTKIKDPKNEAEWYSFCCFGHKRHSRGK